MKRTFIALAGVAAIALAPLPAAAQVGTSVPPVEANAPEVTVQKIEVHSDALDGNLEGNAATRTVFVMLPPGYDADAGKRYPVLYALHGYSIGAEQWLGEIHTPQVIEGAYAKGAQPMIVVFPDSKTAHNGSMYSSSPTTGDFENFVARDLVAYVDANYRTIPDRRSRGLVGHSMGGYGASRIGMKHADVFGALYMMSPCCMSARGAFGMSPENTAKIAALGSPADSASLDWGLRAQLAAASAWSPNPQNPPLYLDLPDGDEAHNASVLAKWAANAPLSFVDQYVGNLRRYAAISMDVGDEDGLRHDAQKLHEIMDSYGIANGFEIYQGDHTNRVAFRFQDHVMPFFSEHLVGDRD